MKFTLKVLCFIDKERDKDNTYVREETNCRFAHISYLDYCVAKTITRMRNIIKVIIFGKPFKVL